MLVWICISTKGVSTPFFSKSGLATNQDKYLRQCIIKRLIPFIELNHSEDDYVFWPDLATAHYAKSVTNYLDSKNVNYVAKDDNPPNVPECRPIEHFWSLLKGKVYKNNWQAKTIKQLKNRINYCLKNIDLNDVQELVGSIPSRLDQIRRNGVLEEN